MDAHPLLKLLTIRDYAERYGAESHMLRVAAGAARQGWAVHAAFPHTGGTAGMADECAAHGITLHPLTVTRQSSRVIGMAHGTRFRQTCRLLRRVRPDVTQITLGWPSEALGFSLACAVCQVPALIVFQLAPEIVPFRASTRQICAWSRRQGQQWVAVSTHNRNFLSESFRMPVDELTLLYNGTETETPFSDCPPEEVCAIRASVRDELRLPPDSRLLLTTGRLSHQKGYFDLIEVVAPIVAEFPDVHFLWAGTGKDEDSLRHRAREQGITERIHFLGYRTDVLRLLRGADLFVFPSLLEGGCSSSIREAMVHRVPLVSSDTSGIPEVVRAETDGVLFSAGDRLQLHRALQFALTHPDTMRERANSAHGRIQQFSTQRMVQDYLLAFAMLHQKVAGQSRGS